MIFSKKLRKTAASVLALVMVFAMSTGAFADGLTDAGNETLAGGYYTVKVNYEVVNDLPADAQISIIALAGQDSVDFDKETNTANNVLWIDQQAATAKTGSFEFQVDAEDAGEGFYVKSGVTGGETMSGYVTIATQEPDDDEKSDDATLSAITVNGTAANLTDKEATYELASNAATAKIGYTAAAGATAVITGADNEGNVTLTAGVNTITITVTAEDGTTTETYTLTITNPASGNTGGGEGGDTSDKVITEETKDDIVIDINGGASFDKETGAMTGTEKNNKPFGIDGGKVVEIEGVEEIPEGKAVAVKGQPAFYTSYDVDGDGTPEVRFVTLITLTSEETLSADDITYVTGTNEQLVFGESNDDGVIDISDALFALKAGVQDKLLTNNKLRLLNDPNGDGVIDISDALWVLKKGVQEKLIPDILK